MIASFFEWLQNRASQYWHLEEVDKKLKDMLLTAYGNIVKIAKEKKLDMRVGGLRRGDQPDRGRLQEPRDFSVGLNASPADAVRRKIVT